MKSLLCVTLLGVCLGINVGMATPVPETDMTMEQVEAYMMAKGYMGPEMPDPEIAELVNTNKTMALYYAIKIFQMRYRAYGLKDTGVLDKDTMALLKMPHCGVKDIMSMEDTGMDMRKRKRRYSLVDAKWEKLDLTYKITQYPRDRDLTRSEVDSEIDRALKVWSDVTPLKFYRIPTSSSRVPDIEIQFSVTGPYEHGDAYPFDGESGTLAHAFFPFNGQLAGDAHFDEAERWTINVDNGINLFQVAAHEFGHSLGLGHSEDPTALMAPFYPGYQPNFRLPGDDIMGIQALYGGPESRPDTTTSPPRRGSTTPTATTTPTTTTTPVPPTMKPEGCNICREARFDAITTLVDNYEEKIYGFRGEYYFLIDEHGAIAEDYPKRLDEGWVGLPNNIDAALYWEGGWNWNRAEGRWEWENSATFVFKGDQYWRVEDMRVAAGPRNVSDWGQGFPTDIDAAMVYKNNGKTYLFKGDKYYRYTEGEGIDAGYPRSLSVWNGLPESVDAALQTSDGDHYFFKGNRHYFFDNYYFHVHEKYPKHNREYWMRCNREQCRRSHRGRHSNRRQNSQRDGIVDIRNLGRN